MISRVKSVLLFPLAVVASFVTAQAFAQAPTTAQRSAIKSACRSDYMAHCARVPPGGMASLQCLQTNMASLSSSCQAAVKAVEPAAEARPAASPASSAESKPGSATKPAAGKSSTTKSTASKSATAPATEATGITAPAAAIPAAAPATAPMLVLRPLRPLEEIRIVRAACGADARAFCGAIEPGGGRVARCLAANAPSLSPACKSMLLQFAAQ